tara:strand:- start:559 stop:1653 length:1095 start_codon:yes stop_codon:yes gene_type:complete
MINYKNEHLAYRILNKEKIFKLKKQKTLSKNLDELLKLFSKLNSPLIKDLKIQTVLNLKWVFDYLNRYLLNPDKLNESIDYHKNLIRIYHDLANDNWLHNQKKINLKKDIWTNTRKSFNFMWPKTTKNNNFDLSLKMVIPRVKQICQEMPKNFLKDSKILDSGCGPARYINEFLKYNPKQIIGIDSGQEIIKSNQKRFKNNKKITFKKMRFEKLNFEDNTFDYVNSAGVIHHSKADIGKTIKEHARVLKKEGYFFVFIVGKGGLQLKLWEFVRRLLNNENISEVYNYLNGKVSPLRIQGILDHSFGEYQETDRKQFEKILKQNFKFVKRIKGIEGVDCTPELYKSDKFFKERFGTGDLRYICKK